jgi:hypothetical protein
MVYVHLVLLVQEVKPVWTVCYWSLSILGEVGRQASIHYGFSNHLLLQFLLWDTEAFFLSNRNKESFTGGVKADIRCVRRFVPLNPSVIQKMNVWIFLEEWIVTAVVYYRNPSKQRLSSTTNFILSSRHRGLISAERVKNCGVPNAKIVCMYALHGWERERDAWTELSIAKIMWLLVSC